MEAYRKARRAWILAIDQQRGHAIVSTLWQAVVDTARKVGVVPGVDR